VIICVLQEEVNVVIVGEMSIIDGCYGFFKVFLPWPNYYSFEL